MLHDLATARCGVVQIASKGRSILDADGGKRGVPPTDRGIKEEECVGSFIGPAGSAFVQQRRETALRPTFEIQEKSSDVQ